MSGVSNFYVVGCAILGLSALGLTGAFVWPGYAVSKEVDAQVSAVSSSSAQSSVVVDVDEFSLAPTAEQRDFQTMSLTGREKTCVGDRPPFDLHPKAYVRNSYAAILDILAVQRQKEEGDCGCYFDQFEWSDVISASKKFETDDTPIPPFNLNELREQAKSLKLEQLEVCGA